MKNMKHNRVFVLLLIFSFTFGAFAQNPSSDSIDAVTATEVNTYNLDRYNSIFTIKGTSSLHDWEMVSKSFDGNITIERIDAENFKIKDISISLKVTTLDSENRIMNNKTYDALKNDKHPNIKYKFNSVKNLKSIENNQFEAMLNGNLSIAGVTKSVDILLTLDMTDKKITVKGEKPMKMSDFDVEPPKALLGTIKTGNDITIEFTLNYEFNSNYL
jgi:polyisoprenoid-binding protein YceI